MQAVLPPGPVGHPLHDASDACQGDPDGSLLDDPVEWSTFGRALDGDAATGRWESQVVVEGMHCAACALSVEAALARVPGVQSVEVNAASRRARVVWSAAAVKPS